MSEAKYRLINAIGKFAKLAPPSEEFVQYQLMAAMQYYKDGHYEEAIKRLVQLGSPSMLASGSSRPG